MLNCFFTRFPLNKGILIPTDPMGRMLIKTRKTRAIPVPGEIIKAIQIDQEALQHLFLFFPALKLVN